MSNLKLVVNNQEPLTNSEIMTKIFKLKRVINILRDQQLFDEVSHFESKIQYYQSYIKKQTEVSFANTKLERTLQYLADQGIEFTTKKIALVNLGNLFVNGELTIIQFESSKDLIYSVHGAMVNSDISFESIIGYDDQGKNYKSCLNDSQFVFGLVQSFKGSKLEFSEDTWNNLWKPELDTLILSIKNNTEAPIGSQEQLSTNVIDGSERFNQRRLNHLRSKSFNPGLIMELTEGYIIDKKDQKPEDLKSEKKGFFAKFLQDMHDDMMEEALGGRTNSRI